MDAKARSVLGRGGEQTKPAQFLLESVGFEYLDEVDPFDGGPHYGCKTDEILPIKEGKYLTVTDYKGATFKNKALVATSQDDFKCCVAGYELRDGEVALTPQALKTLGVEVGEQVFLSPFDYNKTGREQT